MLKDPAAERKARNERHFAAAWYGKTSGFEEVHGLLDRVMLMLRKAFLTRAEGLAAAAAAKRPGDDFVVRQDHTARDGYWLEPADDEATFLAGRAATVYLRLAGRAVRVGEFGILHPTVLEKYVFASFLSLSLSPFPPRSPPSPPASRLRSPLHPPLLVSISFPVQHLIYLREG